MIIFNIHVQNIRWLLSELRPGLCVNFIVVVKPDKALFIGAADHDIQVFHGNSQRYAFLHGQFIINNYFILWILGRVE